MRVLARIILVLLGALTVTAGIALLVSPKAVWSAFEPLVMWSPSVGPPTSIYVLGIVVILLGILLTYTGIRKFTRYSVLIGIIGVIYLAFGVFVLTSPSAFRNLEMSAFYGKPDSTKILLSYISGVIRVILGVLFIIAGISRERAVRITR